MTYSEPLLAFDEFLLAGLSSQSIHLTLSCKVSGLHLLSFFDN